MAKITNPRVRLGRGQRTSGDALLWEARRAFLAAVCTVSPETYWSLFPGEPTAAAVRAWRDRWENDPGAMIRDWQDDWNLTDQWVADVAANTVRHRFRRLADGVTFAWGIRWSDPEPDYFVTPHVKVPGGFGLLSIPINELFWDQERETRKFVRDRLIAIIDDELTRVESESVLVPVKTKSPEHFVWLARNHVLRKPARSMAIDLINDPDATLEDIAYRARPIQKAIVDTAKLIGLRRNDANNCPNSKSS